MNARHRTATELDRHKRFWIRVAFLFAALFGAAVFYHVNFHPEGVHAWLCYGGGAGALLGCLYAVKKYGDDERFEDLGDGLSSLDEVLALPELDD